MRSVSIISGCSTLHGALRSAERNWVRRLDAALSADNLTDDHWAILTQLSTEHGVTMSELASQARLAPSSATRHADNLAERGLIFRVAATDDRRRILIGLSSLGAKLVAKIRREEQLAEEELKARLGARRYNDLVAALAVIADQ
ncbi:MULTISPECIES: MarR family transcriptional regulator [Nocardia]|uniref:MarR family winged helix-turn-helix transcriptional regulator n=1 Tax=Nocardia TaxID=1817 RepID=UPI0015EFB110|nr:MULTISPECIES: MarR family transcriptional regulator [Nocardia]MCA2209332.1 MarR family transcriptional regulator [Nocardia rosealba]